MSGKVDSDNLTSSITIPEEVSNQKSVKEHTTEKKSKVLKSQESQEEPQSLTEMDEDKDRNMSIETQKEKDLFKGEGNLPISESEKKDSIGEQIESTSIEGEEKNAKDVVTNSHDGNSISILQQDNYSDQNVQGEKQREDDVAGEVMEGIEEKFEQENQSNSSSGSVSNVSLNHIEGEHHEIKGKEMETNVESEDSEKIKESNDPDSNAPQGQEEQQNEVLKPIRDNLEKGGKEETGPQEIDGTNLKTNSEKEETNTKLHSTFEKEEQDDEAERERQEKKKQVEEEEAERERQRILEEEKRKQEEEEEAERERQRILEEEEAERERQRILEEEKKKQEEEEEAERERQRILKEEEAERERQRILEEEKKKQEEEEEAERERQRILKEEEAERERQRILEEEEAERERQRILEEEKRKQEEEEEAERERQRILEEEKRKQEEEEEAERERQRILKEEEAERERQRILEEEEAERERQRILEEEKRKQEEEEEAERERQRILEEETRKQEEEEEAERERQRILEEEKKKQEEEEEAEREHQRVLEEEERRKEEEEQRKKTAELLAQHEAAEKFKEEQRWRIEHLRRMHIGQKKIKTLQNNLREILTSYNVKRHLMINLVGFECHRRRFYDPKRISNTIYWRAFTGLVQKSSSQNTQYLDFFTRKLDAERMYANSLIEIDEAASKAHRKNESDKTLITHSSIKPLEEAVKVQKDIAEQVLTLCKGLEERILPPITKMATDWSTGMGVILSKGEAYIRDMETAEKNVQAAYRALIEESRGWETGCLFVANHMVEEGEEISDFVKAEDFDSKKKENFPSSSYHNSPSRSRRSSSPSKSRQLPFDANESFDLEKGWELINRDLWIHEMRYRLAVVVLADTWHCCSSGLGQLFKEMKSMCMNRRVKLHNALHDMKKNQANYWQGCFQINGISGSSLSIEPMVTEPLDESAIEKEIGKDLRNGALAVENADRKLMISKGGNGGSILESIRSNIPHITTDVVSDLANKEEVLELLSKKIEIIQKESESTMNEIDTNVLRSDTLIRDDPLFHDTVTEGVIAEEEELEREEEQEKGDLGIPEGLESENVQLDVDGEGELKKEEHNEESNEANENKTTDTNVSEEIHALHQNHPTKSPYTEMYKGVPVTPGPFDSPLVHDVAILLRKSTNMFKPWKVTLCVRTSDYHMHLFDIPAYTPSNLPIDLSPSAALMSILPQTQSVIDTSAPSTENSSYDSPKKDAKKVNEAVAEPLFGTSLPLLNPTYTIALKRSSVSVPKSKTYMVDIVEVGQSTGFSKLFTERSTKKYSLKCLSANDSIEWIRSYDQKKGQ